MVPPPRPLAGLPTADPAALAHAWLLARLGSADLAGAPALASSAFVERAPALCGSLLAALGDDAALAALTAAGPTLAALASQGPAPHGAALVAAAEHLRAAAVSVLMPRVDPALLPPLHDRLAHACSRLLAGALATDVPRDFTVRDARLPPEPRAALTAEAERLVVAGAPFALLAVEVEDAAVIPAGVLAAAEAALLAALPPGALHAPDGPGSFLALAAGADGRDLAVRLTRAVASAASHHGAPLRAAAGVARHPGDGDTPEGLLAHADGQLFAARAEGVGLL